MICINFQDSRPIYEQIVDGYKHSILAGVLEQDERMPSVRNLAGTLHKSEYGTEGIYGT